MSKEYKFVNQTSFYRGKVRDVYGFGDHLLMITSDRISAFDVVLPRLIPFKGQVLNQIAAGFLKATSDLVPNWVTATPDPSVTIGKRCEPFKVEMVIRGYLAGHAAREYALGKRILCGVTMPEGLKENDAFPTPIITPTTKASEGHDEDISREDLDRLAAVSQERAAHAIANGHFDKSLVPVYHDDGTLALDKDEFPRPSTTRESLSQLNPSFEKLAQMPLDEEGATYAKLMAVKYPEVDIKHVHHAGNSSGVVDGAAALLLASPEYATKQGWTPRARVVAFCNMGDCPSLMLNAPVPAAKRVLAKAGLEKADIDLWEINEAFAVVAEKFIRDLELDRDTVNVNGGAMALGHPIGATGAMLIGTMVDELERRQLKRGLITMCAGGGMAPAIIVERI